MVKRKVVVVREITVPMKVPKWNTHQIMSLNNNTLL